MNWIDYSELIQRIQDESITSQFSGNAYDPRFLVFTGANRIFIFVYYVNLYQVGCWLNEESRGKGYGSLCFGKSISYLAQKSPRMLIANTNSDNKPMQKILKAQKFRPMGFLESTVTYIRYF